MFPPDPENRDILNPNAVLQTCFSSSAKSVLRRVSLDQVILLSEFITFITIHYKHTYQLLFCELCQ